MAALSTAIIVGASVAAAGAVTAGVVGAVGASKAAKTTAEANREAIAAQERTQAAQLTAQEKAAAEEKTAAEKAAAEKAIALKEFKYPGVLETAEGKKLIGTLEERMAGIGVGYKPTLLEPSLVDVSKTTAPFAAQTRAGLTEQTIPAITAAASARGLGRSTIPVSQIGVASQAAERDIESRIAELTLVNTELKRQAGTLNVGLQQQAEAQRAVDIQNALTQYGGLTTEQVRAKQIEEQTRLTGEFDIADTEMGAANTRFNAATVAANANLASSATISNLISTGGATQAAYELQRAAIWGSAIQQAGLSFSQAYTKSNDDIIKAIENQQNQNAARVAIASPSGRITEEDIYGVGLRPSSYRLLPRG